MKQVIFNDIDISTYGFMPLSVDIPSPKPRLYYVDVAGRNGKIDVTNFMGDVTYQNIDIKIKIESYNNELDCRKTLMQLLGKEIVLQVLEQGIGQQYSGRMSNYTCKRVRSTTSLEITLDVNPIPIEITPEVQDVQD